MTTFFVDLWHDLREKRLWPVAVGLLAAIVAVPAVLFKPASDAAPPSTAAPKPSGVATLPVVSVDSGPEHGSKLEAFKASEKNPFKPMKDLATTNSGGLGSGGSGSSGSSGSGSGSAGSGSSGSSSSSGGLGGTSAGSGSSSSSGGGASSSSGGSTAGGGSSPSSSNPSSPTSPTTKWFRYAADFSFGATGQKAKTLKSVANFTLLPSEAKPVVVFLGVDSDGKSAMFYLSDASYTADGEGSCNADGAACRFVTLKLSDSSNEETFTALDGSVSYDLKLLKISRQDLGSGSAPATSPAPKKSGKTLEATGAGVSAATDTAAGVIPSLFAAGPGVARQQK